LNEAFLFLEHQHINSNILSLGDEDSVKGAQSITCAMEHNEEDDDVKLAKASAGLLADLELCLPKVLWKACRTNHAERGRGHSHVRRKDVDYVINLVCLHPSVDIKFHVVLLTPSSSSRSNPSKASPIFSMQS